MTLGAFIRSVRVEKSITQAKLADAIGVSQNVLSRIESDRLSLSELRRSKIAEVFGWTTEELERRWRDSAAGPASRRDLALVNALRGRTPVQVALTNALHDEAQAALDRLQDPSMDTLIMAGLAVLLAMPEHHRRSAYAWAHAARLTPSEIDVEPLKHLIGRAAPSTPATQAPPGYLAVAQLQRPSPTLPGAIEHTEHHYAAPPADEEPPRRIKRKAG
jgi:transcriptional regulator with XRE-family HTH domain